MKIGLRNLKLSLFAAMAGLLTIMIVPPAYSDEPNFGEILMTGFDFCPDGWTSAEGQLLTISSNRKLFAVLDDKFGGDGETKFRVPDLRAQNPLGRVCISTKAVFPHHAHGEGGCSIDRAFSGEIKMTTANNCPVNFLEADGRILTIKEHSLLYSVLRVKYGGDGRENFALPKLNTSKLSKNGLKVCIADLGVFPERTGNCTKKPIFLGELLHTAFDWCPLGFVEANGQLVPIDQNQSLFTLLQTRFGGDGQDNFGLPDLRRQMDDGKICIATQGFRPTRP